jgi:hypothetical protein
MYVKLARFSLPDILRNAGKTNEITVSFLLIEG